MSQAMLERPVASGAMQPLPAVADAPLDRHRRVMDPETAWRALPRGDITRRQAAFRWWFDRTLCKVTSRLLFRVRLEGAERIQDQPAVYVFNHMSWMDPLALIATFPKRPQLYFFGPKEADMSHGGRNKLMWWSAITVPFRPTKDDLVRSVRHAQAVFDSGGILAISGEGEIHVHEGELLPFQEGAAYLALRSRVPIVPVAITGTSWARFRGKIRVRIGEPIQTGPRPTKDAVDEYTARAWHALHDMVRDDHDPKPPSRFWRWVTDLFNDWGPGGREQARLRRGATPEEIGGPSSGA